MQSVWMVFFQPLNIPPIRVDVTGTEPCRDVSWNHCAQPCLRKEAVEVKLRHNLSWVLVKEAMANTTPV